MARSRQPPPKFIDGLRLYYAGEFWHSHEAWEDLWRQARGVERHFYQGLIQLDAAVIHTRRAEWTGVVNLLRRSLGHLKHCPRQMFGLNVAGLRRELRKCLSAGQILRDGGADSFNWSLQPKLYVKGIEKMPAKQIACIGTEFRLNSHVDVILMKFLEGCVVKNPAGGPDEEYKPQVKVASLYLDQFPANDLGRVTAARHNVPLFDTIDGALTLGGRHLAVDAVLIIGEHGQYPSNDRGQKLYPRRRLFEEVVRVFERTGKVVPVFSDKHLSYSWSHASWMYETARRMKIPFMAGSSLPVAWRKPALEYAIGCQFEEALALGYSDLDAYGFHTLEVLQCMVERRRGGETGIRSVTLLQGDEVWRAGEEGRWSWPLANAALECGERSPRGDTRTLVKTPYAFLIEYADGLKANALMLTGQVNEFLFAGKLRGQSTSPTLFWLQEGRPYGHFYRLAAAMERMFLTGVPTYPVERTLVTTGILAAAFDSKAAGGKRIETPWLNVRYSVKN